MVKRHYFQPNNTTCGQTSMAMILGITPQESIRMYGHDGATYQREHIKILKEKGYDVDSKFTKVDNRRKYTLPDLCLVRIAVAGRRMGHMIVHYKGKFFDPANHTKGIFESKDEIINFYNRRWRIEYYLEIRGKDRSIKPIEDDNILQKVAGEKRFKVRVSHDLFNRGELSYINRIVTESELQNLKKSDKFTIESCVDAGE